MGLTNDPIGENEIAAGFGFIQIALASGVHGETSLKKRFDDKSRTAGRP
jgi:hypothetical protein